MRKRQKADGYKADTATKDVPLRLDEVEALALSGVVRDPAEVTHLLSRVAATIKEQRRRMGEMQRDLEITLLKRSDAEHPSARAAAALEELGEDGRRQFLDQGYLVALERVEGEQRELERARVAMISESNRARFALASVLEDLDATDPVRARIEAVLAQLPR